MAVSFAKTSFPRATALKIALFGLTLTLAPLAPAHAQLVDSKISATYKIGFNGLHLGKLRFKSTVKGKAYTMESSTKLSVPLLGSIFKSLSWRGMTKTSGTVRGSTPRPTNYYFAFNNGKKRGKIDMDFAGNQVARVVRIPNKKMNRAYVQVTRAHLQRVMDPMSALMLISRTGKSHRSACQKTIPIYDGKQRFNLKLSYKRSVRVNRSQSGGYAGPVIICRVRYQPIAGYKLNKKDIKFMAKNRNIELWLMPLPQSRNYAPYRFIIPLPVGTANASLVKFNIRNARGRKIALVR